MKKKKRKKGVNRLTPQKGLGNARLKGFFFFFFFSLSQRVNMRFLSQFVPLIHHHHHHRQCRYKLRKSRPQSPQYQDSVVELKTAEVEEAFHQLE